MMDELDMIHSLGGITLNSSLVKHIHLRCYDKTILKNLDKGGITISYALLGVGDITRVYTGFAFCSPNIPYNKSKGKSIANDDFAKNMDKDRFTILYDFPRLIKHYGFKLINSYTMELENVEWFLNEAFEMNASKFLNFYESGNNYDVRLHNNFRNQLLRRKRQGY